MQYFLSLRTLLVAVLAVAGAMMATVGLSDRTPALMSITPTAATVAVGETATFAVVVESRVPVNAFTGELVYDSDRFIVSSIDYNTSIANLWVEEPWYNRAENSLYFAGGTTQPGGFVGKGELLRVTLQARSAGDTTLTLRNERILAHDGLGNDVALATPLDALFSADVTPYRVELESEHNFVAVVPEVPPLDVNQDGELGFQDISVLLLNFGSSNAAYDFTGDGTVSWADIRTWQRLRALQ